MAKALRSLAFGRFRVLAMPTRMTAFKAAATVIRLTRRPVALLVWRGAPNWVVSGSGRRPTRRSATTSR
jgi:hypothetical protein